MPTDNFSCYVQFQKVDEGLRVGGWVDLTRWMYLARGGGGGGGGGGAGSWRRHGAMIVESIS